MGKKLKGKQKQDEKPAGGRGDSHPLPGEPMHQSPMSTEAMMYQNEPVPQESTWGTGGGGGTWGTTGNTNPAVGDTWGVPAGIVHHQGPDDSWGHAESLLQPPPSHAPSVLTSIPEQPTNQYIQNRTALSDIGESHAEYSEEGGWDDHGSRSPHQWANEGPQSRTLTATAAPSAMASPVGPPPVSLAEAAEAAQREREKQRTSASEAARRMEESRRHSIETQHMAHSEAMRPSAHAVHKAATQKPTSSASAAAAALSASMPHNRGAQPPPSESGQSINGKTSWVHPKPFMPNSDRQPARIPVDPSWIHTGGNAWSNKGLGGKKTATAVNWAQPVETSWGVPRQSFHPPPPPPQPPPPQQQQHSSHRKHHSTGHPSQRVHHQRESENHQSWQGWGKGASQGPQTETEDDEETVEGDEWGQTGAESWGGAWGQPPPSIHGNQGKGNPKSERGRGHRRKSDPAESWGGGEGDWPAQGGQAAGAWGQPGGDDFKAPSRNWGEQGGNDSWGPPANHDSGWGGDNFEQQAKGGPAWGQPESKAGGGGGGGGGWGQEKTAGGGGGGWSQEKAGGGGGAARGQEKPATTWGQAQDPSAWGQGGDTWGNTNANGGAPTPAGWGSPVNEEWGTKVASPAEVVGGSRNALSPQQHSQILNSLLNQPHTQNLNAPQQANIKQPHGQGPTKAATMKQDNWGAWNADDSGSGWGTDEEDGDEEAGETRKVRFSPKASDIWGGSPRSVPSKSLAAQAQQGITTTIINDASYVRFVESSGAGLAFVSNALFGNARLARERVHWLFPSDKDQRVAGMLAWVQKMSFNLGTYGLLKFLENRERGGLFVNAAFRMRQHPQEPAFDFLTFDQLQATMDKTLQESVAFYDPSEFAMVFIFLPSQTGNSVAIWRRKINVPDSARRKYRPEIEAIKRTLRPEKEYVVMVDELPKPPQLAPPVPGKPGQLRKSGTLLKSNTLTKNAKHMSDPTAKKKKKKWWKLFLN